MNPHLPDIENKADIKIFVDAFYEKARIHPTLGSIFIARIKPEEWQSHMDRIYSFWNTVLFSQPDYIGNPFSKHKDLPIVALHFNDWLALLNETLDSYFKGPVTEDVKDRAYKMGLIFQSKLDYLRDNGNITSII